MDTLLTVNNEDLSRLNSQQAVEFFRDLLWSEASRSGIPFNKINVSARVNVPDGGIDASIIDNTIPSASGFIASGHNGYQIKTGDAFEPWQQAQIHKELFGSKELSKENLGDAVRECLDKDGRYVLVCFGKDLIDEQQKKAIAHIKESFTACNYANTKVEVWSANNLIGFLKDFPALSLRINKRATGNFETHYEWSNHDDMSQTFIPGTAQQVLINNLQTEIRRNNEPLHIRVWGEPGIGKTRIVLEATKPDDLRGLTIYTNTTSFRDSNLMQDILRGDYHAILVLDECDSDNRAYIWNKFKYHSPRIKLITIYNEHDDARDINYIDVPALEDQQIGTIIQSYGVPHDKANGWARECSGSPRVAHVIGSNLINNPEDLLKSPGTVNIWDRYIVGLDKPESLDVNQRRLTLSYLALFKRFGYGIKVQSEATAIAELIQKHDPQITWPRFQEIISVLRTRKILQGQNTLYITPRLLHIKLWIDWWQVHGEGFDVNVIFALPLALVTWFFEMFQYAAGSEVASRIARDLLGESGPFQQHRDLIRSKLGAFFFRSLAKAEPAYAVKCLKSVIGSWTKDDLLLLTEGRRDIVWALEDISKWSGLFEDAARLLLILGEAENESWTNNASGVFADLFLISHHIELSKTESSPSERFPILKEAVESVSKEKRLLGLRACERWLTPRNFGTITDTHQIVGKHPNLWIPKTWGELFEAYRLVWDLLERKIETSPKDEQVLTAQILLRSARHLIRIRNLNKMLLDSLRNLASQQYVNRKELLETVIHILYYDIEHLEENEKQEWEKLKEEITGQDYHSLLQRYVGMNIVEDSFDKDGNRINTLPSKIEELSQKGIEDPKVLEKDFHWLVTTEANNGYLFGYELAKRDEGFHLLSEIIKAQRAVSNNPSAFFLAGYMRFVFETNLAVWEQVIEDLANDKDLSIWVPELTGRVGSISDSAALRVLRVIKENKADARGFSHFVYGKAIEKLSEVVFQEWIVFLLTKSEVVTVSIALDLFATFYVRGNTNLQPPEELTLQLITHPILFSPSESHQFHQFSTYHWEQISECFISLYPNRSIDIADVILNNFGQENNAFDSHRSHTQKILAEISRQHSEEVWKKITRHLTFPLDSKAFYITHWLRGNYFWAKDNSGGALHFFPKNLVWQWVDEDIEQRAWFVASFIPPQLSEGGWAREILIRYGKRDDVKRNLIANFSTEGWTGPESAHLERKKEMLVEYVKRETDESVKAWIDGYVISLERRIEQSKVEEEREDF